MYGPDEVFKFTGHYGYQSSIVLEEGEEVVTISMGDSVPWQITPQGNRIFLKPVQQDAQTNMTLITNLRTYLFELHAEEADEGISDPDLIWVLKFIYPAKPIIRKKREKLRKPEPETLQNFNFNYSIRGSYEFSPIKIYDDGEFTYFQFRDKNAEIPAFFQVAEDGSEGLVNFRTRDDLIIVERIASRFTLRHGNDIVCVYNEARPFRRPVPTMGTPPAPPMTR
jgi:type IV secretion system protein VirB9